MLMWCLLVDVSMHRFPVVDFRGLGGVKKAISNARPHVIFFLFLIFAPGARRGLFAPDQYYEQSGNRSCSQSAYMCVVVLVHTIMSDEVEVVM